MLYISRFVTLHRAGEKVFRQVGHRWVRSGASLGIVATLAAGLSACVDASLSGDVNQLLLTVEPGDRPGVYQLSGTTDLPEDTELMVQAVRHLTPTGQSVPEDNSDEHYAILDRDRVQVADGSWAVELQLWQTSGGEAAESWQLQLPQSDRSFTPDSEVRFTVSMPPTGDELALESQWEKSKQNPSNGVVNFTPDGEWFLQAEEFLAIAPPDATVPDQPNSFNARQDLAQTEGGIPRGEAVDGSSTKATTDAPLDSDAMLR